MDNESKPKISKDVFRNSLNLATKESFFMFNSKLYKKIVGEATESFYGRYVDDILIVFHS